MICKAQVIPPLAKVQPSLDSRIYRVPRLIKITGLVRSEASSLEFQKIHNASHLDSLQTQKNKAITVQLQLVSRSKNVKVRASLPSLLTNRSHRRTRARRMNSHLIQNKIPHQLDYRSPGRLEQALSILLLKDGPITSQNRKQTHWVNTCDTNLKKIFINSCSIYYLHYFPLPASSTCLLPPR